MNDKIGFAARFSLVFLWIFSGITSLFFAKDIGYSLLASAGIIGQVATLIIIAASVLDMVVGAWLWAGKWLKCCYLVQMITILLYSILLTAIEPSYWLHPFGPLTKNLPVLVLIFYLYSKESSEASPNKMGA